MSDDRVKLLKNSYKICQQIREIESSGISESKEVILSKLNTMLETVNRRLNESIVPYGASTNPTGGQPPATPAAASGQTSTTPPAGGATPGGGTPGMVKMIRLGADGKPTGPEILVRPQDVPVKQKQGYTVPGAVPAVRESKRNPKSKMVRESESKVVHCSQCSRGFSNAGVDAKYKNGFSHCKDHKGIKIVAEDGGTSAGSVAVGGGNGFVSGGIGEAPELFSDNVIYNLDRTNPMDDTEILVIGGGGRYGFKTLRDKATREAKQLATELKANDRYAFEKASRNVKQLANTLNTIVAAYDQLEAIRKKGGPKSRGIRDDETIEEMWPFSKPEANKQNSAQLAYDKRKAAEAAEKEEKAQAAAKRQAKIDFVVNNADKLEKLMRVWK